MKKILITITAIVLFINIGFGQDDANSRKKFQFGLKAGANYSNIYDSETDTLNADNKLGFVGGAFIAIPIGKFVGIQPEVLYSQKGFSRTGSFLDNKFTKLSRTTHYIDVPLLVSIKPINFLTIQVGPQFSFLMKQKDIFTTSLATIEQESDFINDNIRKNTLGLIGGFDFNFKSIVVGTRAGWDIQNNNGDGTSTNPRYKNAWVQATLGFRLL